MLRNLKSVEIYQLDDFGVRAEWYCIATSHGMSAGDGAGGILKQIACRASFQQPYQDQILTACQLYKFAISDNQRDTLHFCFTGQRGPSTRRVAESCSWNSKAPLPCATI